VLIALNSTLRRQRRRLAMVVVMLGLAGAIVTAHSAMGQDHMGGMGDAVVMCLAVAETAVVAVGVALAMGLWLRRARWLAARIRDGGPRFIPAPASVPARAGPALLQVFRL
jgi:hypothetical protein